MPNYRNLTLPQLETLAFELALQVKDRPTVIGLIGTLGAGKTTFVKAFAKALGIKKITSPTFVIMHEYPLAKNNLYHLDFYRLENQKQLTPLALDEILKNNLVLIEWVDRFPKIQKQCDLIIKFKVNGNLRNVTITS